MLPHRGQAKRGSGLPVWACALLQLALVSSVAAASLQRRGRDQEARHRRENETQPSVAGRQHAADGSPTGLPSPALEGRQLNDSHEGKGAATESRPDQIQQRLGLTPKQRWKDNFLLTLRDSEEESDTVPASISSDRTLSRIHPWSSDHRQASSAAVLGSQAAALGHSSAFSAPPHVGLQRLETHLGTKGWGRLRRKMKEVMVPKAKCNVRVGKQYRFRTVQSALNAIGPNAATHPVVVCISPGTYFERVHVGKKQNGITLQGYGMKTIITWNNSASVVGGPFKSATLIVEGGDFTARTLMVLNSVLSTTDPSPAVTVYPNRTTWDRVGIVSWDDTLAVRSGSSHLLKNCFVSGLTDMTWGFGRVAFVSTEIFVRNYNDPTTLFMGDIATYGTDSLSFGVPAGAVYWNCLIDGDGQSYLGRPYRALSIAIYANCYMGTSVVPSGWNDYVGYVNAKRYTFREYNSYGPGARKRRMYGRVLTGTPPRALTVQGSSAARDEQTNNTWEASITPGQ